MVDLRLEVQNGLRALADHDPFLDEWERGDLETVIKHLDAARRREARQTHNQRPDPDSFQTPILDCVIPVQEH